MDFILHLPVEFLRLPGRGKAPSGHQFVMDVQQDQWDSPMPCEVTRNPFLVPSPWEIQDESMETTKKTWKTWDLGHGDPWMCPKR